MACLHRMLLAVLVVVVTASPPVFAADAAGDGDFVPRQEYDQLKSDFEAFKKEMRNSPAGPNTANAGQEQFEYLEAELEAVRHMAEMAQAGSTKFLITGYGFATYSDMEGSNSTFGAGFNPIFVWELTERLLFEAELELELDAMSTALALEFAHASYLLNDYVTLGAGKFLTPFGVFGERLHPAWINKLPDKPLFYRSLIPHTSVGAYVRGGFPVASKMNYVVFVTNGPQVQTTTAANAGLLDFHNFSDSNNGKAVGGRVGYLPIPELEVGGSFLVSEVSPDGFSGDVTAVLFGFDISYVKELDQIGGTIDVRTEWVWSDVEDATYDPTGALGFGPITYDNERNGGYIQVAYRPSKNSNKVIKNLEGVFRYDFLGFPSGAPASADQQMYTCGLNFWITPSTVLKAAFQVTDTDGADTMHAFLFQSAIGF